MAAGIHIYPSPASLTMYIKSESALQRVVLLDMLGQHLYDAAEQGRQLSLDVSAYKRGFYFLQITADGKKETRRVHIARK